MKTIKVKLPDYFELKEITGREISIKGFESLNFVAFKTRLGWLIFESQTGYSVTTTRENFKTLSAAVSMAEIILNKEGLKNTLKAIKAVIIRQ